ncbi:RING-H2 finger protein ATL18 [Brachypodium distachyon]|uniref:RING-H2 finger protein ATL18 n=1 Tax=Brachypodium distachyon TaxID=15368 RepID=UPI0001C7089A|nr:RING-H2 finger protein ATL18 [Brachypodium distachyon]|eukprot:XP_010238975.1 RING-H2 finger protein ATL18 [Brachypodium distachyon]
MFTRKVLVDIGSKVFWLGLVALLMLFILRSIYQDCVRYSQRPFSAPTPVPSPARTAAAAGPSMETCSCVNPAPVVHGGGDDPRAARRLRATGPVPCVTEYRRGDGWREAMCPVCLCDFADGAIVRVLPPRMHYFHAACVGEWLHKGHATCPRCRAAPPSAAAASGSPEYVISMDQLELS